MLSLPSTLRVYLAPGATDMRKSFDQLFKSVTRIEVGCWAHYAENKIMQSERPGGAKTGRWVEANST